MPSEPCFRFLESHEPLRDASSNALINDVLVADEEDSGSSFQQLLYVR